MKDHLYTGTTATRLPVSVNETSITSSTATIQWVLVDPFNPSRPETFTVSYGLTSGQLNMSTPGVAASHLTYSAELISLQPGTEYFYKVESRNELGAVSTELKSFKTTESSKFWQSCEGSLVMTICTESSRVLNLRAWSPDDTVLDASWELPASPNGRILSYNVSIINLGDGSTVKEGTISGTRILQANLGNS
jgi:hypothetical protein